MLQRFFYLCITLVFLLSHQVFAQDNSPQTCDQTVKLAGLNWESGRIYTGLVQALLEKGYGCQTTLVPGTSATLENALAHNDIQVIAEQWMGRSPIVQKAIDEKKVVITGQILKGGASQGWYIPDYMVHGDPDRNIKPITPNLKTYQDILKNTTAFTDPENPRKSRFYNCPSGWTCEVFNTHYLRILGLDKQFINFHPGTGSALDSAITSAYQQGKPILFYYWQPTAIMAKYKWYPIKFPPFDKSCLEKIIRPEGKPTCLTGFAVSQLGFAFSSTFADQHPQMMQAFSHISLTQEQLNQMIVQMTDKHLSAQTVAENFLRDNPNLLQEWLPENIVLRIQNTLEKDNFTQYQKQYIQVASGIFLPLSIAQPMNHILDKMVANYGGAFRMISSWTSRWVLIPLERLLTSTPAWLILFLVGLLAWVSTKKVSYVFWCVLGLYMIGSFGLWYELMQTLSLVLSATILTIVIGIPIGIALAYSKRLNRIVQPILDMMQTMPSFVYLIPILMLFGLGKVPALFATLVYAIAPLIRLTSLGIQEVDKHVVEASEAFGSNRWQRLCWVVLPLARPTIMAGINQAVMLSLSMVVLASMIGARGLGEKVLSAIQTLNVGEGLQAGIAIVILAMVIDRISQGLGRSQRKRQQLLEEKEQNRE